MRRVPHAHFDDQAVAGGDVVGGRDREGGGVGVAGRLLLHEVGAVPPVPPVGVTAFDGVDAGPVPTALVAVTVNVYVVPLVRPVTVADGAGGLPVTVVGVWATPPT